MGERWGLRGRRKGTRAAWFAVRVGVDAVDMDQSSGETSFAVCQEGLQEGHGGHEVALLRGHREVDGVEVCVAVEATAQIGAGIDGRHVLTAAAKGATHQKVPPINWRESGQLSGPGSVGSSLYGWHFMHRGSSSTGLSHASGAFWQKVQKVPPIKRR